MASTDSKKASTAKPAKPKTIAMDEIYNGFKALRNEQRALIQKVQEVGLDLSEHEIVLDTLKDLDGDRKCFRLIGGVLCEKTVKDVIPVLTSNKEQLSVLVAALNHQVTKKGEEINEYKIKNNMQKVKEPDDMPSSSDEGDRQSGGSRRNVMVNPV